MCVDDAASSKDLKPSPGSSSDSCMVPACVALCREVGSATSVLLEQSILSLERGHLSPPASSRLSLENSAGMHTQSRTPYEQQNSDT